MEEKDMRAYASELTGEVLGKMGFASKVDVQEDRDSERGSFVCMVTVPKEASKLLIGQYGANLSALQYLIQHLSRRRKPEMKSFSIDVNRYWREKRSLLEQDALEAAHKAVATGRPVLLRPMVAYERKIIHTALVKDDRVETESSGKGEERKVIVKPSSLI
jgi:predicted RNA-binding protein Jag